MCGIAGFIQFGGSPFDDPLTVLTNMSLVMAHRGPDGHGYYINGGVGLVHRRLAVIDLETGDQPMASSDGRLRVIYNGEIYNHRDLRRELAPYPFKTRSDTEVLLAAYDRWGIDFPKRLNGIFAFALWDASERLLLLCRDPFGIKPLHFHLSPKRLAFASEIKSLLVLPDVHPEINLQAVHDFMNLRYVPGTKTLFSGICRLEPGHILLVGERTSRKLKYFDLQFQVEESTTEDEWCEQIVHTLKTAVKRQLMADVPLGVYLSGGMDSSALVAMMHELGVPKILTFSMGFNEPTDELKDAEIVARHFGTQHFPLVIDPQPLRLMEKVLWHVEEPQVNMLQGYYIAAHASDHVKVVLGGLGGDELFAGYINNIFLSRSEWAHRVIPGFVRKFILNPLSDTAFQVGAHLDARWDEYRRGVQLLCAAGAPDRFYAILRNVWDHDPDAAHLLYGQRMASRQYEPVVRHFQPFFSHGSNGNILGNSLWLELNTKMIDDFLLSEDRVSMAHGLEARVPFLDIDLVRLAFSIPARLKMRRTETKSLFRRAMRTHLPHRIIEKKKWGFSFNPYFQFQKDLKTAVEEHLTPREVRDLGLFNFDFIANALKHPPHPRLRWHYFMIWTMLGFHQWYKLFIDKEGFRSLPSLGVQS